MSAPVSISDLMTDPDLFGGQFSGDSWAAWRALLAGFYGLPLNAMEIEQFQRITSLSGPGQQPVLELWLAVGRRGGKSQIAALVAVYEAAFKDYTDRLSPGEVATVMVLAQDRKQARTVMRYISGLLHSNPMMERLILREQQESIELTNRTIIEVQTASFRSVRGYSVACVIADEIAFWRSDESANPDTEIINALRPAMATLNGKLIALSSPYAERGALWDTYHRHYGKPGSILVAQAPTLTMNPTLPERVVNEALERDPEAARAEYLAEFRSDLETFLLREVVDAAVRSGPLELAFDRQHRYFGFADPAGGGADEFCLAIGHKEGDDTIVDLVRARRGIPAEITAGLAELLKTYGIRKVTGDKYAGSWPGDEFAKHGIKYTPSEKPKSSLYLDLLPSLNSGRVELPPDDQLLHQIIGLERRTARGGRDSIDHPRGSHDDRANVVAGLVSIAKRPAYDLELFINGHHAVNEKPDRPQRRSSIEAIRRAGIPL
jgi:hypothetical protein